MIIILIMQPQGVGVLSPQNNNILASTNQVKFMHDRYSNNNVGIIL